MLHYEEFHPFPNIIHFRDSLGVNFSLIKGSKMAILFDTGYGLSNIRKMIETKITTPYIVINSHGHMDHTGGNYLFDEIYIHEKDMELCKRHNTDEKRMEHIKRANEIGLKIDIDSSYTQKGTGQIKPIILDKIIDLGDLHIRIIPMEGHTQGSIGLFIEEMMLLLTADAAILNIWLFLEESTSRERYINMLKRVKEIPFVYFLTGHISRLFPKEYFEYFLEVAEMAAPHNSVKVKLKGFERENTYQYLKEYQGDKIGICFYQKGTSE